MHSSTSLYAQQAREAKTRNDTNSQAESEAILSSVERKADKGRSSQVRQLGSQPYQVRTWLAISPEGPFPTLPTFLLSANLCFQEENKKTSIERTFFRSLFFQILSERMRGKKKYFFSRVAIFWQF